MQKFPENFEVQLRFTKPIDIKLLPMSSAPWGEYVLLAMPTGYRFGPAFIIVTAIRQEDYHAGRWTNEANDDISDSHPEEPAGWLPYPNLRLP